LSLAPDLSSINLRSVTARWNPIVTPMDGFGLREDQGLDAEPGVGALGNAEPCLATGGIEMGYIAAFVTDQDVKGLIEGHGRALCQR